MMRGQVTRAARLVAAGVFVLAVAACSATYRNHGYVPKDAELETILLGSDTRETVAATLGTPSSSGVMADSGFYYIRSRVRNYAYRRPEIIERDMVAVTFDAKGAVNGIERYTLEDGRAVRLSRRVTDPAVRGPGLLRSILNNFGNFNASDFFQETDGF